MLDLFGRISDRGTIDNEGLGPACSPIGPDQQLLTPSLFLYGG